MPLSGEAKEKGSSKTTKTSKNSSKANQNKKSPSKGSTSKDMRAGNNLVFSGNMTNISAPSSSDLAARTLYTGVSISPYLGKRSGSYVGQNPYAAKASQQMTPMQPVTMAMQHIPKIDKVFSYQPNVLSSVSNSGVHVACIDSVKDLSLGPHGKVATSIVTSFNQPKSAPSTSKQQSVHTRLPQYGLPYQAIQKAILPSTDFSSQAEQRGPSFQSLMTSCSSTPATTGGNFSTGVGVAHQSQMSFPLTNFSQALSLPNNCQITTSEIYTQVPQTSQVIQCDLRKYL